MAGSAFTTQPVVYAVDAFGNPVPSASVILSAFTNVGCSVTGTGSIANGVVSTQSTGLATFSTASYSTSQTIHIKATSGTRCRSTDQFFSLGGVTACSSGSVVVLASSVSSVSFSTQPGGSITAGSSFTTQPIVVVSDTYGNPVPSANVALTAFTDPACGVAALTSLNNQLQTTSGSGLASFSGVSYNKSQTVYLKATSGTFLRSLNLTFHRWRFCVLVSFGSCFCFFFGDIGLFNTARWISCCWKFVYHSACFACNRCLWKHHRFCLGHTFCFYKRSLYNCRLELGE